MYRSVSFAVVLWIGTLGGIAGGAEEEQAALGPDGADARPEENAEPAEAITTETICDLIDAAADKHEIPVDFFTRLIWQESSFRIGAVSPKGAQGIAQFMPGTAKERGLADPFDPEQAIPASASLLSDLQKEFGNLGLAAAAYNAGRNRVGSWLAGQGGLPWETRHYVAAITGRQADDWAVDTPEPGEADAEEAESNCLEQVALLGKPSSSPQVRPGPWAPWGVQVAGNFSQDRALARYASLQRKYPSVLGGQAPLVKRALNRSRGTRAMFHVRVPADTRQRADEICRRLKAAGGSCVVFRN